MNITKMEYKALFFLEQKFKNIRDILNIHQLSIMMNADDIVLKALNDGMDQGLDYKDIYKLAKERIEIFAKRTTQNSCIHPTVRGHQEGLRHRTPHEKRGRNHKGC